MTLRARLTALAAASLVAAGTVVVPIASPTAAAAPTRILNDGAQNSGNTQWVETQSVVDAGSVQTFVATFLVEHAAGRRITQALGDLDFDATTDANTSVVLATQFYGSGTTNFLETSRVTVQFTVSAPDSGGRIDVPIRFRLVDDIGGTSQTVSANLHVVDSNNSGAFGAPDGIQDYPRLTSASQTATEGTPGTSITYNFTCEDVDLDFFSSDDDCDRANIRWRRLSDGAVSDVALKTGIDDASTATHTMSFPSQGHYVVEAQLGNEDGTFPDTANPSGGWWRLGNADVNDGFASLSGSLSFSGVQPSSPPSVNPGTPATATAMAADSGGAVQVIEWDADGNGTFERREYTVPLNSGGDVIHPALTSGQLQQSINTSTPGLKTVNVRITDNGALDAADNTRRQFTFSGQLRVNAVPTASNINTSTNEDTPKTITLVGADTDNQPDPLTYEIVSAPAAGAGTLGSVSGNQVEFTPASNFHGSTSFTYRVRDGGPSTVDAWAHSNTATVTITVLSVNDPPTVDPKSATTNEDTPVNMQATGTDVEGPLTWSVASQPANGTATCNPTTGLCTYSPASNFSGNDSFVVRGTDNNGASATATFSVAVNAVNDAPIGDDQSVSVAEDAANFPITLTASDVEGDSLTWTIVSSPSHGQLSGSGPNLLYSPDPNFNGADSFVFQVADGHGGLDTATVAIDVTPVNDSPVAADGSVTVPKKSSVSITLQATDVDGDQLIFTAPVSGPSHGTLVCSGASCTYTPNRNYQGPDEFSFVVDDGNGGSDSGVVSITVKPGKGPGRP